MNVAEPKVNLVIRGATLIDGGGGPPVSPGVVAIAGPRIVYAGSGMDAPPFPEARSLSLDGACLLPGLIDMHIHATYYWDEPDSATYTYEPEGSLVYSPAPFFMYNFIYTAGWYSDISGNFILTQMHGDKEFLKQYFTRMYWVHLFHVWTNICAWLLPS